MSENTFQPYLKFVPNQILKASDLNSMQEKIKQDISDNVGNMGDIDIPTSTITTLKEKVLNINSVADASRFIIMEEVPLVKIEEKKFTSEEMKVLSISVPFLGVQMVFSEAMELWNNEYSCCQIIADMEIIFMSVYKNQPHEINLGGASLLIEPPETGFYIIDIFAMMEGMDFDVTFAYPIVQEVNFIQSDWNQEDPTLADYIKNRPFYQIGEQRISFLENFTIQCRYNISDEAYSYQLSNSDYVKNLNKIWNKDWHSADIYCNGNLYSNLPRGSFYGGLYTFIGNQINTVTAEMPVCITNAAGSAYSFSIYKGAVPALINQPLSTTWDGQTYIGEVPYIIDFPEGKDLQYKIGISDVSYTYGTWGHISTKEYDGYVYKYLGDLSLITKQDGGNFDWCICTKYSLSGEPIASYAANTQVGNGIFHIIECPDPENYTLSVYLKTGAYKTLSENCLPKISWEKISNVPVGTIKKGTILYDKQIVFNLNEGGYSAVWNMGIDLDILYSNKTYLITLDNHTFLGTYSQPSDTNRINIELSDPQTNEVVGSISSSYGGSFTLYSAYIDTTRTQHYMSIALNEDADIKLDKKFLPEGVVLPEVTSADEGKILKVVNGIWTAVAP